MSTFAYVMIVGILLIVGFMILRRRGAAPSPMMFGERYSAGSRQSA